MSYQNSEIIRYVRRNNHPVGCVVFKPGFDVGEVQVGWSFTHRNDRFSKEKAKMIARNRAATGSNKQTPREIQDLIDREMRFVAKVFWS